MDHMKIQPRISLITLGVKDIEKSKKFYSDFGFFLSPCSSDSLIVFETGGVVLCLYPVNKLAEDALMNEEGVGFKGVTFAFNVASPAEVNQILKKARVIGGKIIKPAQETFWGGYSGYFSDLDENLWEIAWNPHWPLDENGQLHLPEK